MPYFCFQLYYSASINIRKDETQVEMGVLRTAVIRYLSIAELKKGLSLRVAYVVLQQADLLLTKFAISSGFEELNPVIGGSIDTPVQLLLYKLIIPVIIAVFVPAKLLLPALVLLLMVIGWNIKELILFLL
jgi:hypothetical protein